MSTNKEEIKSRARTVVLVFSIVFLIVLGKIIYLQQVKKEALKNAVKNIQSQEQILYATRGNIYAADGLSLLATSVPTYEVLINPSKAKKKVYDANIDSLCIQLSHYFKDKTVAEYRTFIDNGRKNNRQYLKLVNKEIKHNEKLIVQKFPLFRSYKEGGYFDRHEVRFLPLQNLASRTIGKMHPKYTRKGAFGLEASFENYLKGKDGKGFYQHLAGGYDKPVDTDTDINAEPGKDIVTTLDINFQDIAESALKQQVEKMNARFGSVVVMEIASGHVKAIANLTRKTENSQTLYIEDNNYAVREGTDPGSTFKLATMAAILEHSDLDLNAHAVNCVGVIKHGKRDFVCDKTHGELTVQGVFENSCNLGIYALLKKTFGLDNLDEFYAYLDRFGLTKSTNFQLKGENIPVIKNSKSKSTSGTTLPWMSIGYETRLSPLQMLTFYNAVVNQGRRVQPIIVKQIRSGAKIEQTIEADIVDRAFISAKTHKKLVTLMEGVVLHGTASGINNGMCRVAGKTGTAQKSTNNYASGKYYTSFIGYFPANKPRYSCAVVIDEPQGINQHGSDVSAPVFKNIAEKIFAYDISLHPRYIVKSNVNKLQNFQNAGLSEDQNRIAKNFGLPTLPANQKGFMQPKVGENKTVTWQRKRPEESLDQLRGLSLKDALPILENKGYRVSYLGSGRVKEVIKKDARNVDLLLTYN